MASAQWVLNLLTISSIEFDRTGHSIQMLHCHPLPWLLPQLAYCLPHQRTSDLVFPLCRPRCLSESRISSLLRLSTSYLSIMQTSQHTFRSPVSQLRGIQSFHIPLRNPKVFMFMLSNCYCLLFT